MKPSIQSSICTILMIFLVQSCTQAEEIRKEWEIKGGTCKECVELPEDGLSAFDFAVYQDRLFLTDYLRKQIKVFDKAGHVLKTIKLATPPEIITQVGSRVYILLRNNTLSVYDIERDSSSTIKLKEKLNDLEYSGAFFMDSVLAIPMKKDVFEEKSDARVLNVANPQSSDTVFGFFNFSRIMVLPPDSTFKHAPSRLIDLCGGNENYFVLEKFESKKNSTSSGYILFNRKENTIRKLDSIPEKFGTYAGAGAGRGAKFYNDRVYFISETSGTGGGSIVIVSYPLK